MTQYDTAIVTTDVATPYTLSPSEAARIQDSLVRNGLAVVRNFIPASDVRKLQHTADAATQPGFSYGKPNMLTASASVSKSTQEFRHPFLISDVATRLATNGQLLDVIEKGLDDKAIIHHGLFQRSLPADKQILDWHIDCGSNKSLNGSKKFDDNRVRMIVYLSDVDNGGFSYIVGSGRDALPTFYPLPIGELYPQEKVPADEARRVTVNEPAGTLILFNTHGLHRPEVPRTERMVLNIWFARRDFRANLPAALFSMALVPSAQRDRLYVFDNERGFDPLAAGIGAAQPRSITQRIAQRISRSLAG